jgi:hypothetical protein
LLFTSVISIPARSIYSIEPTNLTLTPKRKLFLPKSVLGALNLPNT